MKLTRLQRKEKRIKIYNEIMEQIEKCIPKEGFAEINSIWKTFINTYFDQERFKQDIVYKQECWAAKNTIIQIYKEASSF